MYWERFSGYVNIMCHSEIIKKQHCKIQRLLKNLCEAYIFVNYSYTSTLFNILLRNLNEIILCEMLTIILYPFHSFTQSILLNLSLFSSPRYVYLLLIVILHLMRYISLISQRYQSLPVCLPLSLSYTHIPVTISSLMVQ